jgi:hypothetical protein
MASPLGEVLAEPSVSWLMRHGLSTDLTPVMLPRGAQGCWQLVRTLRRRKNSIRRCELLKHPEACLVPVRKPGCGIAGRSRPRAAIQIAICAALMLLINKSILRRLSQPLVDNRPFTVGTGVRIPVGSRSFQALRTGNTSKNCSVLKSCLTGGAEARGNGRMK